MLQPDPFCLFDSICFNFDDANLFYPFILRLQQNFVFGIIITIVNCYVSNSSPLLWSVSPPWWSVSPLLCSYSPPPMVAPWWSVSPLLCLFSSRTGWRVSEKIRDKGASRYKYVLAKNDQELIRKYWTCQKLWKILRTVSNELCCDWIYFCIFSWLYWTGMTVDVVGEASNKR